MNRQSFEFRLNDTLRSFSENSGYTYEIMEYGAMIFTDDFDIISSNGDQIQMYKTLFTKFTRLQK